jgi:hypothetical protein
MADLETLSDLATPWCLRVAVTLRVAEQIAAGVEDIGGIAAAVKCDRDVLHRVMAHLVGKGVFAEPQPGCFSLNEAARVLLDPGMRLALDLTGIGGRMAYAWGGLLTFVKTGEPGYREIFGRPFWEDLEAHPEVAASFDALIGPGGHGKFSPEFSITGGWDSVRTVVDVGGGTGSMLAALLRARPWIHGTLVELPRTVAASAETFRNAGVSDRVTTAPQSFFDPLPAGADLYLLRGVINDWPDREAVAILRRCAEAARLAEEASGRVVVLKGFAAEGAPKRLEIEQILAGGKVRTVSEFRELARQSGLEVVAAGQQPGGYFVVECRPALT